MPAADEVWRLQQGRDADARFFTRMAELGHYRGAGGTRQGVYACAPGGVLLGSVNSLDPARVAEMLEKALQRWDALPPVQRRLPADARVQPRHRWEHSRPEGGLILERVVRDLEPHDAGGWHRTDRWNRDFAWFTPAEARGWVPPEPVLGSRTDVPEVSRRRLACLSLVDNVRGQTLPFAPQDLAVMELASTVTARDGSRVRLRLEGRSVAETDGTWRLGEIHWKPAGKHPRGMTTRIRGRATFDLDRGIFTDFELLALGRRHGGTPNNGRHRDPPEGHLGFVFSLAPQTPAGGVAPTFIDLYDADWVKQPQP